MGFYAADDHVKAVPYRVNGVVKVSEMYTKSPKNLDDLNNLKQISHKLEGWSDVCILAFLQRSFSTLNALEPLVYDYWFPVNRDED